MEFREFIDPLRHNDGADPEDIFWIGVDPHVDPPRPGETWHRGQWHDTFRLGHITWWTRSGGDAHFYAQGGGKVYEAEIDPDAKFGTYKDLVRAVRESGAKRDDIRPNSGFDGSNDNDFVYVPEVQDALKKRGIQGLLLSDVMANYEIDAMVVLDQRILKPLPTR